MSKKFLWINFIVFNFLSLIPSQTYLNFIVYQNNVESSETTCTKDIICFELLPPTKDVRAKVMFLHVCVILLTVGGGGGVSLYDVTSCLAAAWSHVSLMQVSVQGRLCPGGYGCLCPVQEGGVYLGESLSRESLHTSNGGNCSGRYASY